MGRTELFVHSKLITHPTVLCIIVDVFDTPLLYVFFIGGICLSLRMAIEVSHRSVYVSTCQAAGLVTCSGSGCPNT